MNTSFKVWDELCLKVLCRINPGQYRLGISVFVRMCECDSRAIMDRSACWYRPKLVSTSGSAMSVDVAFLNLYKCNYSKSCWNIVIASDVNTVIFCTPSFPPTIWLWDSKLKVFGVMHKLIVSQMIPLLFY